jgi:hypothetical protein
MRELNSYADAGAPDVGGSIQEEEASERLWALVDVLDEEQEEAVGLGAMARAERTAGLLGFVASLGRLDLSSDDLHQIIEWLAARVCRSGEVTGRDVRDMIVRSLRDEARAAGRLALALMRSRSRLGDEARVEALVERCQAALEGRA